MILNYKSTQGAILIRPDAQELLVVDLLAVTKSLGVSPDSSVIVSTH